MKKAVSFFLAICLILSPISLYAKNEYDSFTKEELNLINDIEKQLKRTKDLTDINDKTLYKKQDEKNVKNASQNPPYNDERVLVKFKDDTSKIKASNVIKKLDSNISETIDEEESINLVNVPSKENVLEFIDELNKNKDVEIAQPDYIYESDEIKGTNEYNTAKYALNQNMYNGSSVTNDPKVTDGTIWHIFKTNIANKSGVGAWDFATGKGVNIAILDSGIDPTITELKDNITYSYDAVNDAPTTKDISGHCTHLSSIIAAKGNNSFLGAGISYDCNIMPIRVATPKNDNAGVYSSDLIKGYNLAVEKGAKIINISIGSNSTPRDLILEQIIDSAYKNGVVTVCSGGNESSNKPHYPADFKNTISVTALSYEGDISNIADFSSYNEYKDIASPGEKVYGISHTNPNSIRMGSGTSQAAAFTSGVMGLIYEVNPDLSPSQAKDILCSTAIDKGIKGKDDYYGYGEINPLKAVKKAVFTKTSLSIDKTSIQYTSDMRAVLNIDFTLPIDTKVDLVVKDSENNIVKTLIKDKEVAANTNIKSVWDFKNQNGNTIRHGSYKISLVLPYNNDTDYISKDVSVLLKTNVDVKLNSSGFYIKPNYKNLSASVFANLNTTVDAYITDRNGTVIKSILKNYFIKKDSTKTISWNFKRDNNTLVTTNNYNLVIKSKSDEGAESTLTHPIKVTSQPKPYLSKSSVTATQYLNKNAIININYKLNTPSFVTIKIYNRKNNKLAKTFKTSLKQGSNTIKWNLRKNNKKLVSKGKYKAVINVKNLYGSSTKNLYTKVISTNKNPKLSSIKLSQKNVSYAKGYSTKISYTLNTDSFIKAYVKNSKGKTIRTLFSNLKRKGRRSNTWNLNDNRGNIVPKGTYYIYVKAATKKGTKTIKQRVKLVTKRPKLTLSTLSSFSSRTSSTYPYVTVNITNANAQQITTKVYDSADKLITSFVDNSLTFGKKKIKWDLKDKNGKYVPMGKYYFKVSAKNASGSNTATSKKFQMKYKLELSIADVTINEKTKTVNVHAQYKGIPRKALMYCDVYDSLNTRVMQATYQYQDFDYWKTETLNHDFSLDDFKDGETYRFKFYCKYQGVTSNIIIKDILIKPTIDI